MTGVGLQIRSGEYLTFSQSRSYMSINASVRGKDFFRDCLEYIPQVVHKRDVEQVCEFINKDNMISALENHKDYSMTYHCIFVFETL